MLCLWKQKRKKKLNIFYVSLEWHWIQIGNHEDSLKKYCLPTVIIACSVWKVLRSKLCASASDTKENKLIYRCPWCNGYRRRKWTRRHEFKSLTRLIEFYITLIPLGKVWIQLFSLQLWVNSRTEWVLQPWWGN